MKPIGIFVIFLVQLAKTDGWHSFQGYEYLIVYSPNVNSYAEAEAGCVARGAILANVKTTQMQNFLVKKIGNLTGYPFSFYIGATRIGNTNTFQWTDGTTVDVGQWAGGEPNNNGGKQHCVIMGWILEFQPLYRWYDISCTSVSRYICQKAIPVERISFIAASSFLLLVNVICLVVICKLRRENKTLRNHQAIPQNENREGIYNDIACPVAIPRISYINVAQNRDVGDETNSSGYIEFTPRFIQSN